MSRFRGSLLIGLWALLWAGSAVAADGETRVALVIGIAHYAQAPELMTPVKDAEAIAERLRALDFEVELERDLDNRDLVRTLRTTSTTPVIIVTGQRRDETDRIVGLELGADDYLTKPFNPGELAARIRAVLRRASAQPERPSARPHRTYRFAGWRLDLTRRTLASPRGKEVHLTAAEFQLLTILAANANQVLGRERLLEIVADRKWQPYDRTIDQHISRLRRKLEKDPKQPQLIKSIRGRGYVFTVPVASGR